MGKKTFNVDGHLYIWDDECGKIQEVIIKDTTIPKETLEKVFLAIYQSEKQGTGNR